MCRLEAQAGRALEYAVVRYEWDSEAESGRRNPAIGVVLALGESVADPCALGAQLGVDRDELVAGVHDLDGGDLGVELAVRAAPQPRRRAP